MQIYSNVNYKILLKQFISLPSHNIIFNSNIKNNIDTIPKYIDIPNISINRNINIPINIGAESIRSDSERRYTCRSLITDKFPLER